MLSFKQTITMACRALVGHQLVSNRGSVAIKVENLVSTMQRSITNDLMDVVIVSDGFRPFLSLDAAETSSTKSASSRYKQIATLPCLILAAGAVNRPT